MKRVHNDSIAGKKICIRFSYLRPQESDNIPQHSRTVHNNPQQFTTSQCKGQQQPTIFETYNFLQKNCLHLSICACHPVGGPMLPPSSACSRRLKVTITCIRGKGSAGHQVKGGGPPYPPLRLSRAGV